MATKTPATGTARASGKTARAKSIAPDAASIDRREVSSADDETKIYEVTFENLAGHAVLFTVEHANKTLLKASIAEMPPPLQSKKPKLRLVNEPAAAHFKLKEWVKLSALSTPGIWHFLANPKEFERAAKKYAKIDPLARVFGKKALTRNKT
jgi:hypothetical protein